MAKKPYISDTELITIWDWNNNPNDNPEEITIGSAKKTNWICKKGHNYQQSVNKKVRSGMHNCPVCSNQKIVAGINDIATTHPEVMKYWDYTKNSIKPTEIPAGSERKVWWLCDKNHSYQQTPHAKTYSNHNCPVCSNQKIVAGINDMATTHPDFLKYWNYDKNTIKPTEVSSGTDKMVWWKCDNGHSTKQSIHEKIIRGKGCMYCSNRAVYKGYNDLASKKPELLQFWDYEKNTIRPDEILFGSYTKVWWKCEKNKHGSYFMSPHTKNTKNRPSKCPLCAFSNKRVVAGVNDLITTHPETEKFWDYEKNTIKPTTVSHGSSKIVWWKCDNGHSYKNPIKIASVNGAMCSKCNFNGVSRSEKEVLEFIKSILPEKVNVIENTRKVIYPYEIDIYIPEKKIAIEYNGLYWHTETRGKDKNYHYNKWKKCKDKEIQLITIWEDDWDNKQDIVKKSLSHKLGVSKQEKIYAKKTVVDNKVSVKEVKDFCNNNHIQGFCGGSYYFGLRNKNTNDLVAVSIWRKNKDIIYLDRYCTSSNVVGGFSKLLKHAKETFLHEGDVKQIITFSDHTISDGNLYKTNGFILDKEIAPDYCYLYNNKRCHKFGFRKTRFKNNPNLLYEDGLTEKELAELNCLERIYDYGKTRWVINIGD